YGAACTPDFSIFDGDMACVYRGQFDDSRAGGGLPVTGSDIRNALDNLLSGKAVDPEQKHSIGCSIKWHP
ncbi:MAG TPA: thioredoxin family protein, partial [Flavobacteriales bacterium]|nr:thioredoxin family protein [Flavobacteriales bacterium]